MSSSDNYEDGVEDKIIKLYKQVRCMRTSKRKGKKIPKQIASRKAEANNLYIFGQREKAQRILEDIIRNYPDYEEAYQLYGLICQDQHDIGKAANFLMLAAKSKNSTSNQKNWMNIAYLLKEEQNYEFAALYFGKALKSDPNNVEFMNQRVICFERIGEYRKAIKEIEKIRFIADNLQMLDLKKYITRKLVNFQIKTKQFEQAKEELKIILSVNDEQSIALMNQILLEQNKIEEIVQFCEKIYQNSQQEDVNNKIYQAIIKHKHYLVLPYYLIGIRNESVDKYNELCKEYLDYLLEKPNYNQTYQFFNFIDQNDLEVESYLISEFYQKVQQSNEMQEIQKFLESRYTTIINKEKGIKKEEPNFEEELLGYCQQKNAFSLSDSEDQQIDYNQFDLGPKKKVKIQEDQESQVFLSDEEMAIKQEQPVVQKENTKQLFSEFIQKTLHDLIESQTKEETHFILNQLKELLDLGSENYEMIFGFTKKLVQFEKNYYDLKRLMMEKFTKESQKRNFKKAIKSSAYLSHLDQDEKPVLFRTQNFLRQQGLLKKRKNKMAEVMTEEKLKGIYCLSIILTTEECVKIFLRVCKTLFLANQSFYLYKILYQLEFKLSKTFINWIKHTQKQSEDQYIHYMNEYCIFGLWSSLKENQYLSCFPFIKRLISLNPNDYYKTALLSLVFKKIPNAMVYKTWVSKIALKIQTYKNMTQPVANQYFNNACFEPAIKLYDYILQTKPQSSLLNFLLCLSFLQIATSRLTTNKEILLKKSLYFFDKYQEQRQKEVDDLEIIYNLGRLYAHLNIISKAIDLFEEVITKCEQKEHLQNGIHQDHGSNEQLKQKAAYNLVQLHQRLGNQQLVDKYINTYLTF